MKVLILSSKFGMGHYHAATTLAQQIRESGLAADVYVRDIYQLAFPKYCELFYQIYAGVLSKSLAKGCKLYNFAYTRTVYKEQGLHKVKSYPKRYIQKCIAAEIERLQPDVVVSTYSYCSQLVSDYKAASRSRVPLVTCITDVTSHNLWINPETDFYLVAAESTKQSLIRHGVAAGCIAVSGIPVDKRFQVRRPAAPETQDAPKELLIMGGGLGLLPNEDAFYAQLNNIAGLHTTIITGKNHKLCQKLANCYSNISVLGYTDQVAHYMAQADVLISKPGGISMFEAIQAQLPMLIFQPFLEQEIRNGEFLEEHGLAQTLPADPQEAAWEIARIVRNEPLLQTMRSNMHNLRLGLEERALLQYLQGFRLQGVAA